MRDEEIHENQKIHLLEKDNTGLSLGYRLLWRIRYAANDVYGPASRQAGLNPREALRVERAQRVAAAYREQGEEPPPAIRRASGENGVTESWDASGQGHHGQPPKPFQEGYRYFMLKDGEEPPVMRPNETGDKT
ncbi:hypothetical protein AB0333_13985 [Citricoccus sp. NPDC079358]|uniref:Uncharacterized protein n=1 Tax=Citricoccus muralis TaxID=169134 RepID=A0A3D9LGC7_9MICC|nr:hypothetical protein [Citricoccus muralis]REE04477.1 hypothetical protein C8E99_2313 [Citricoccus muralis]